MTEVEKQILEHLKAIRDILEANGGVQYLSMFISDNGIISANNAFWELPEEKAIDILERGKENNND